jgi:hypothetical protein
MCSFFNGFVGFFVAFISNIEAFIFLAVLESRLRPTSTSDGTPVYFRLRQNEV